MPGVPVKMRSPRSSVIEREIQAMHARTEWMRSAVEASCTTSPFTSTRSPMCSGSRSVAMNGPTAVKVSEDLARHHCRSLPCQARAETSLPPV